MKFCPKFYEDIRVGETTLFNFSNSGVILNFRASISICDSTEKRNFPFFYAMLPILSSPTPTPPSPALNCLVTRYVNTRTAEPLLFLLSPL